ncbi:MAG: NADH-quinone oxidoreductase subunit J [Pirellulales bacterium]|nr:NADH-quinone oxidoreductase subunit J [Pirellulales bacterium]
MSSESLLYAAATVLGAVGMWLLLPRPGERLRWGGAAMSVVALGLILSQISPLGDMLSQSMFVVLGSVTVIAAAAAVTFRNPVYCAIWFAMMLLGTAGLFLLQGAHFLGVATIVVYAGAILVTLLFVLMLANPRGNAPYDRLSWEGPLSATAGIVLVGMLTMTLSSVLKSPTLADDLPSALLTAQAVGSGNSDTEQAAARNGGQDILSEHHSASLGGRMFSAHLVSIEVAGVLLFAALVGAVAIIAHSRSVRSDKQTLAGKQAMQTPSTNGRAGA